MRLAKARTYWWFSCLWKGTKREMFAVDPYRAGQSISLEASVIVVGVIPSWFACLFAVYCCPVDQRLDCSAVGECSDEAMMMLETTRLQNEVRM